MFGGIPFEAFAGGGGMPGGMGGMGGPSKDVDTTKPYETLEVDKGADQKEIKDHLVKGLSPMPLISASIFPELDSLDSCIIFQDEYVAQISLQYEAENGHVFQCQRIFSFLCLSLYELQLQVSF